jgi:adenylosuccinate lyase
MAGMIDSAFFGDLCSTAEMREVWSDRAMIQRWLDVEAALARPEASLGIVPDSAAAEIGRNARVERIDLGEMDHRVSAYLGPKELDALLDPARYTGLAGRFVDRVVAAP